MKTKIFPYLFARYAALPVNQFNQMKFPDGKKLQTQWNEAIQQKNLCTNKLCDLIFDLINQQQDEGKRKLLLNLKRAVFNDRNNIENLIQKLNPDIYDQLSGCLLDFVKSKELLNSFLQNWEEVYSDILISGRNVIKNLTSSDLFQNGVLLSSKDLYQQLGSFAETPSTKFDKQTLRIEFSVLRYLTRMAYKTSPFSTFTYLGLTTLSENTEIDMALPEGKILSKVRINNKLLKRIKGLMENHNRLNSIMYVSLNSSVSFEEEKLSYLMNSMNIEAFQKIPATPINTFIHNFLAGNDKEITLGDFTSQLSEQISATPEEIKFYLLKLVDSGLLELTLDCSEINPDWDDRLLDFLLPHLSDNDAASLLYRMIHHLREVKIQFVSANVNQRNNLLSQVAKDLDRTFSELEQHAGFAKKSPEQLKKLTEEIMEKYRNGLGFEKLPYISFDYRQESIFYEDTFINEIGTLPFKEVSQITEELNDFCLRIAGFDTRKSERKEMSDFFVKTYTSEEVVPVIDFYKAYYKNKERLSKENTPKKPINKIPYQQDDWINNFDFAEVLKNCVQDEHAIYITYNDLKTLPETAGSAPANSAFVQFFRDEKDNLLRGVINGIMPGMGKLNGRFLHLFDQDIEITQRVSNLSVAPHVTMMELNDGSSFNANIHPPLLNYEIKMPASNTIMSHMNQIPINRIGIAYMENDAKLFLIDRETSKEIYAYDLCLESLTNRSNLYQMLSHFNPASYVSYYPIVNAADKHFNQRGTHPGVRVKPRILYEQLIILRRKGWIVEKGIIPVQEDNENESIYFLKIQQWLKSNRIPEDVFIFLKSAYLPQNENIDTTTTRDDYKPQYISFSQPLLINLFKRLTQRAGTHIYLEEVLPHVNRNGSPGYRVSEHLLQWYEK